MITKELEQLIREIPKAENHLHLEGSIPCDLALKLSKKNEIPLPFNTVDEILHHMKTKVVDLETFMATDRLLCSVLINESDYRDLVLALAKDAKEQNVIYLELMTSYALSEDRGISLETVMNGYQAGKEAAKDQYGVHIEFISNIDRTISSERSYQFVKKLEKYKDIVNAIGLDCEEIGHAGNKHKDAYQLAKKMGFYRTAHAGEELGPENVWAAINDYEVNRLDHGVSSIKDEKLLDYLVENKMLLTLCPKSNVFCRMYPSLEEHPVKKLIDRGIICSLNSDDPPYFGNLVEEYIDNANTHNLDKDTVLILMRNAFEYSINGAQFLPIFDKWVKDNT